MFIMTIIFFCLSAVAFSVYLYTQKSATKNAPDEMSARDGFGDYEKLDASGVAVVAKIASIASAAITAIFLVLSCTTMVPPKNVGVATAFGKPVTAYDNGLNFKLPWYKVTDLDGTRQTNTYSDDSCIKVRLADQSEACANASAQWEIKLEGATDLYASYRGQKDNITEAIRQNMVEVQLKSSLNRAFGTFDPLTSIDNEGNPDESAISNAAARAEKHLRQELKRIGGGEEQVSLIGVTVTNITYDERTQGRINGLRDEMAKTRVAQQQRATNKELALANDEIAKSIRGNPEVLVNNCLQVWAEKGDASIPVQCFGSNGDATAVKVVK